MRRFLRIFLPVFIPGLFFLFACMGPSSKLGKLTGIDSIYLSYDHHIVPYKLYEPDSAYQLESELNEISGLTAVSNEQLAAIEDEKGILYLLNTDGSVNREVKFSDDADYEGVEYVNNTFYVLESDGDIYQLASTDGKKTESEKTETDMESSNNTEGFGRMDNYFLIACKSDGDLNDYKAKGKTVYKVDVDTKKIDPEPLIDVTEDQLEEIIQRRHDEVNITDFDPSAIAVSPVDGRIYLLSADMIMGIFSPEGKLEEVVLLMKHMYRQPEGICFTPDGTLYIASEANGGKPQLFGFSRINGQK